MPYNLIVTMRAQRNFRELPSHIGQRIKDKLEFFIKAPNPLFFAKGLENLPPATHRFQIGKYRARFFIQDRSICITKIELRGGEYRG